jgi:hypothetical protein
VGNEVKSFVDYVITCFDNKYLIVTCSRHFKQICMDHGPILHPYANDIIDKGNLSTLKLDTVIPQPSAAAWSNKREYEEILDGISAIIEECPDN